MNKKYDVIAIGELLIDFTQNGISNQGNLLFEANPGGAPCNVLSMLSKLGKKTCFIGKVGDDFFGRSLKQTCEEVGICMDGLKLDKNHNTTLAFVKKNENGDREFSFYREGCADIFISEDDVDENLIKQSRMLHFGTLSFSHQQNADATIKAIAIAKSNDCLISFDPNLRFSIFKDEKKLRESVKFGMAKCDILKISDDEILWITGESNFETAVLKIQKDFPNIKLLLLSKGKNGSSAFYGGFEVKSDALILEDTVETTGAGDTFCACVINGVLDFGLDGLNQERISKILRFASTAAAIITTKFGALKVMPSEEEVIELLSKI